MLQIQKKLSLYKFITQMNYQLLKDLIGLVEQFETKENSNIYTQDIQGFKNWIVAHHQSEAISLNIDWEGKDHGRSAESVISTLIVHLNRFAKNYSKAAIQHSKFATQDEFIYLINLKALGEMTKMELIKKNCHDKPAGIQIINRLIKQGWVQQIHSTKDRRSKLVSITALGIKTLEAQMQKIRHATQIVSGNLSSYEKQQLIYLLQKLEQFHYPIYLQEMEKDNFLENVLEKYFNDKNTDKNTRQVSV